LVARSPQTRDHLGDPGQAGIFIGTVIQLLALVAALIAGMVITRQAYGTQARARTTSSPGST
jgi:hypothetical protein